MAPTNIDGTEITGATIDGQDVSEITVDGDTVFTAIPDSVVHHYHFDEGSGTTATDSEGAADATVSGATYTTDSLAGSHALSFDGSNDYVQLPFGDVLSNGDFTFIVGGQTTNSTDNNMALSNNSGQSGRFDFRFFHTSFGGPQLFLDGLSRALSASVTVTDGVYHTIALRRSGNTYDLLVDATVEDSLTEAVTPDNTVDYKIGSSASAGSEVMDGELDEAAFASEALTDQEIANHPWA